MRRLLATIEIDVRIQFRNGFYVATALVVAVSIATLQWLPREAAAALLPAVIIGNVTVNAFYFASALLLLERLEGTLIAQRVTPLRIDEYLGGKLITLTLLSLAESLLIAAAAFGADTRLIPMAAGIGLAAALFCLVGIAVVVRYASINEFLLPSVLYTSLLSLPVLGVFGVGSDAWYVLHPITGALSLMRLDKSGTTGELVYSILYPLLWAAPAYFWSRRVLARECTA